MKLLKLPCWAAKQTSDTLILFASRLHRPQMRNGGNRPPYLTTS